MPAALGKPNTTLSKEAMEEKKANRTGEDVSQNGSRSAKHIALASHLSNDLSNGNALNSFPHVYNLQ